MEIQLNGEPSEIPTGETLETVLNRSNTPKNGIIVSLNRKVVRREFWNQTIVQSGDEVDVFTAFEGG